MEVPIFDAFTTPTYINEPSVPRTTTPTVWVESEVIVTSSLLSSTVIGGTTNLCPVWLYS